MEHGPTKPPALGFTAVRVHARWDGWTPAKQIAFVEELAATACVEEACRAVGMSERSAYQLRLRAGARSFREAWDAALDVGVHRLEQAVLGRALRGVPRPVFYKGEQVGEWREYDERLAMFLLRYRRRRRFGSALDDLPAFPDPDDPNDFGEPELLLDACCDNLEEPTDEDDSDEADVDDAPDPDSSRNVRE